MASRRAATIANIEMAATAIATPVLAIVTVLNAIVIGGRSALTGNG